MKKEKQQGSVGSGGPNSMRFASVNGLGSIPNHGRFFSVLCFWFPGRFGTQCSNSGRMNK